MGNATIIIPSRNTGRRVHIFRIIGAIIIAFCGVFGAYTLNCEAKRSLEQTQGFLSWLRHIRTQIECFSMPMPQILQKCPKQIYSACRYYGDTPKSAEDFVRGCKFCEHSLNGELLRFSQEIGNGYRQEQLSLCDYYIEIVETRRRQLASELPMKTKLNTSLCISGALALVILLM